MWHPGTHIAVVLNALCLHVADWLVSRRHCLTPSPAVAEYMCNFLTKDTALDHAYFALNVCQLAKHPTCFKYIII